MDQDQIIRLILDMGRSGANVEEVKQRLGGLKERLEELPPAADKGSRSIGGLGNAALQGGRALQDFAQGGIGGVLNNIEGLTMALGGSAGLAAGFTAIGIAAYFAMPKVKEWFHAVVDGANEVPKATDKLESLNEELKTGAKRLDDLRGQQVLTNAELKEFNDLTARQVELEKQITAEKEKRKRAEEVAKLKPFGVKEAEAERSDALKTLFGDEADRKKLIDEVTKGIEAEFDAANKTPGEAGTKRLRGVSKMVLDEIGSFKPDKSHEANVRDAVEAMLNRAITGGGEKDIRNLTRFLPGGSKARRDIEESTLPENLKRQQAEIDAEKETFEARHAAADRARARDRKVREELTKQGKEVEREWREMQRKEAQAEDEYERFQAPMRKRWEQGRTGERGDATPRRGRFDLHRAMRSGVGVFSAEEGAAAQEQVLQATGELVSPRQAVEMVRRQQAELIKAQKDAADAILSSMSGTEQQIAILKQLAKRARQGLDQGVMPSGLPR